MIKIKPKFLSNVLNVSRFLQDIYLTKWALISEKRFSFFLKDWTLITNFKFSRNRLLCINCRDRCVLLRATNHLLADHLALVSLSIINHWQRYVCSKSSSFLFLIHLPSAYNIRVQNMDSSHHRRRHGFLFSSSPLIFIIQFSWRSSLKHHPLSLCTRI